MIRIKATIIQSPEIWRFFVGFIGPEKKSLKFGASENRAKAPLRSARYDSVRRDSTLSKLLEDSELRKLACAGIPNGEVTLTCSFILISYNQGLVCRAGAPVDCFYERAGKIKPGPVGRAASVVSAQPPEPGQSVNRLRMTVAMHTGGIAGQPPAATHRANPRPGSPARTH